MRYTVTGATGNLGSRIIAQLSQQVKIDELRAIVHTLSKATALEKQGIELRQGDYLDVASMTAALEGTDLLIYVPSKTYLVEQRVHELENTLKAVKQAKVKKIIFVSFFADQENNPFVMSPYYGYALRRLASSGLEYAVVKNALYADPLIPYLPELIQREKLIYPVGKEALSFISLDNSAEAIVQLALNPALRDQGQTYLLSQKENYTMDRLGELMTNVTGEKIGYEPVTLEEFSEIYEFDGDSEELSSMYRGGAMGLLSGVSEDFRKITGHDPETMEEFLEKHYRKE
ncbi:NAD(P)H-binding protein [Enterococcus devriesei]|uniref:NmrA family NAD(P)-binding protein n=1 Tax=Enterococcus devriesei TaxID=319970 RepID=UPI0036D2DB6E